jgi:hypothetical protein
MATLTVSFTASANAVKYRVKYRKTGTSVYTTIETTQSPVTINNVDCGSAYEGTVQAICFEGIPCDNYQISSTNPSADGDIEYTDCTTGTTVTQAVLGAVTFYVCSRTTPVALNVNGVTITKMVTGSCISPSPEEASAEVYWSATALPCPTTSTYYYQVTACEPETAPAVPNGEVRYLGASPLPLGTVVRLSGSTYVGWCYTLADYGAFNTSAISVIETELDCNACAN